MKNFVKKNDGTLIHIKLPNILPKIFQIILSKQAINTINMSPLNLS
jgi:hypothetical protein